MIIAIPASTSGEKSFVSDQFGRCNFFYIYNTDTLTGQVYINENKNGQGGVGVKSAEFVLNKKADVLITNSLGQKASQIIRSANVKVYKKNDKIIKENIASYLNGELKEL